MLMGAFDFVYLKIWSKELMYRYLSPDMLINTKLGVDVRIRLISGMLPQQSPHMHILVGKK